MLFLHNGLLRLIYLLIVLIKKLLIILMITALAESIFAQADEPFFRDDTTKVCFVDKVQNKLEEKVPFVRKLSDYLNETNKKPVGRNMDFSFMGGPYYSSDAKFGLGLVASGIYSTCPEDSLTLPSNLSLTGKATIAAHFEIGLNGEHITPHDRFRLTYEVTFSSIDTKYWGIGYEMGINDANATRYRYLASTAEAHFAVRIGRHIYVGPLATFNYINAHDLKDPALWAGEPLRTFNWGLGLSARFDTRDNLTAPTHGIFVRLDQSFDFHWMGNKYPFKLNELTACWYGPLWRGAVLATKAHWRVTWGQTPWSLMSYIGGSFDMRGYFEGRYRDKGEADITVELRQKVWRRNGIVLWGGVASIFPKVTKINLHQLLPNFGVGYRWEFKKNVNVRIDVGFGKHEKGVFFNVNEAF